MTEPRLDKITADAILDLAKLSIMAYQGKWDEWTCDFGAFEKGLNSLVVEDEGKSLTRCGDCFWWMKAECPQEQKGRKMTASDWGYKTCPLDPKETDEEISLRMWEEYGKFCTYKSGKGASPKSFPNWLKERK